MITYEAVPNTDGQILIPVSNKLPTIPKAEFSCTVPPPRGAIPVSRSGALSRPTLSPVHGPISRSDIPRPALCDQGSIKSRTMIWMRDKNDKEQPLEDFVQ
ncbi:hypothetical protein DID88_008205 [Monilinia fructigena]|uniref:Uncharacterized protein n=1 Tax=Monilinia fructigena TaxID=38457 RepID=A0A395J4Q9_9HELO|nr:hypothetical protein DID88_008205 [Monilinia fructigena]